MSFTERIFQALDEAGVRYVLVGGLAVVLHGVARLTLDADLMVDLAPAEAEKAIDALTALGLAPRVPVPARDFADPAKREHWSRDKGMQVFSLWSPEEPLAVVDLFVHHPVDFDLVWERSELATLGATPVRIAGIPDLIALKRQAGRPRDLEDIRHLEKLLRSRASGEEPS